MNQESPNHLLELMTDLAHGGVRFVVAGGVAVVLHGVERTTLDLDLALEETPENLERFLQFAAAAGLMPRAPIPASVLLDRAALDRLVAEKGARVLTFQHPDRPWLQLDVFLTPESSYRSLIDTATPVTLSGMTVHVVSARQLIQMKRAIQPPRDKDIADIAALEKIQSHE